MNNDFDDFFYGDGSNLGKKTENIEEENNALEDKTEIVDTSKIEEKLNEDSNEEEKESLNINLLKKAYIGKNYDKITTRNYSIAGLIFNSFYFLYRKIYLLGILLFFINFIVLNLIINSNSILIKTICIIVELIILCIGLFVNKIYLRYVDKKVNKYIIENPKANQEQLEYICNNKGGTSLKGILILFGMLVIFIIINFVLGSILMFNSLKNSLNDNFIGEKDKQYDGVLELDTSDKFTNYFNITVPQEFLFYDTFNQYKYDTLEEGVFTDCSLETNIVLGYSSSSVLIPMIAKHNNKENEYSSTTINGINWYTFNYEDSMGITYYLATDYNGKLFLVNYNIGSSVINNKDNCTNKYNSIINSISKK